MKGSVEQIKTPLPKGHRLHNKKYWGIICLCNVFGYITKIVRNVWIIISEPMVFNMAPKVVLSGEIAQNGPKSGSLNMCQALFSLQKNSTWS